MSDLHSLRSDPTTPRWAKDLIDRLKTVDIVDVINTLEVIQKAYITEFADRIAKVAEIKTNIKSCSYCKRD